MSFFSFEEDSVKIDKIDPILLDNSTYDIVILTDYYLDSGLIEQLKEKINSVCNSSVNIKIIFPFEFIPSDKELTKSIIYFYRQHVIDFTKHIAPNSKIVTIGRAVYGLTFNSDINSRTFYDYILNNTYCYAPNLKSFVFPVDSWELFWDKDNFNNFFSFNQIKKAFEFQIQPRRVINPNLIKVTDFDKFFEEHSSEKEVAWDIETDGLNFMVNKIGCITMSFDGVTGYYLDWNKVDRVKLNKFFENKYQILANGKFDCKFLRHQGVLNAKVDFDTMSAGHCLNEMRSNSLKTHAWIYTRLGGYEQDLENYILSTNKIKNYLEIPKEILFRYATMDAIVTYQVYQAMKKQFEEIDKKVYSEEDLWNLSRYFKEIVIPSIEIFIELERDGVHINWEKVKEVGKNISSRIENIKKELADSFDVDIDSINWNSDIQLGQLLENNGWKNHGLSKLGHYLVNESSLLHWIKEGKKEAQLILDLHELTTLIETFIGFEQHKVNVEFFKESDFKSTKSSGFWQYRYPDNKIHTTYGVMIADSGRNTSSDPNLQNIPKHGEFAKLIRSYFSPPDENYYIVEFDASGFQLRIGAVLSQDYFMTKAFCELGGDLHSLTASEILMNGSITVDEFVKRKKEKNFKEKRFKAKSVNFGFLFGATGITFSESLKKEWSIQEVEKYLEENKLTSRPYELLKNDISTQRRLNLVDCKYWAVGNSIRKKFFDRYSKLEGWHLDTIQFAETHGYVKSVYGAIRRLPQLTYKGSKKRSYDIKNLQNIALNSPVQNFEVSKINLTMVELYKTLKENNYKSQLVMTVHDSIVLYIYKPELKNVIHLVKNIFEKEAPENKNIPMVIEWDIVDYYGKNQVWGFGEETPLSEI